MRISICMECAGVYRVAKTHRMPGRAAGGGAIAPETAARHRGRTQSLQILASPFSRYFFHFFWNRTSPHFEIGHWIEVRSQNEETSDLKKSEKKQGNDWFKSVGTLVWPLWREVRLQIGRLILGRSPISHRTSKQDAGSRSAIWNWTSQGDVRLEIGHLRRPISRGKKWKIRAWMHHEQRLWFESCGARRLRG